MNESLVTSRRDLFKWTATGLLALGVTACSRYQPDDALDIIRVAVPDVSPRLDPRFATDAFSTRIGRLLYPALVDFDESSLPSPWLATHWQWLDDRRLWVGIRQGLTFHHGKTFTAEDVIATYQSVLSAQVASPLKGPLRNLESVSAQDNGVVFSWKKPDQLALFRLTVPIMPADLLAVGHNFDLEPIGLGACRLHKMTDQNLVLQRPDGVKLSFMGVKDASVRLLKLVRSEIDLLQNDLSPELIRHARSRSSLQVKTRSGTSFSYIGVNVKDPILANPLVRQAIAHAIDRPRLVRTLLDNMATPCEGLFPPEHWCGLSSSTQGYDYQPEKSRQLLAQAGFSGRITLSYKTSTDPTRVRLATVYQAMLKEVGIDLSVDSHDWGTFYSDIKQGRFQLYGLAWVGVKSPEIFDYAFASYSTPPTGANRGHYVDLALDEMLKAALVAPSMLEMAKYYKQIQQHLLTTLPVIPLWHDHQTLVTRPNIKDYVMAADGRYDALLHTRKVLL
jgi:peptide/nickel transport system substrate-binding protein